MKTILKNLIITLTLIIMMLGGLSLIGLWVSLCEQHPTLFILTVIVGVIKIFKEIQ